jgi:hypothetical protein
MAVALRLGAKIDRAIRVRPGFSGGLSHRLLQKIQTAL